MNKMFENLSCEQLEESEEAREIGRELIKGINQALKMASGEIPLPKKSIWEKLEELQEEILLGAVEDDELDALYETGSTRKKSGPKFAKFQKDF